MSLALSLFLIFMFSITERSRLTYVNRHNQLFFHFQGLWLITLKNCCHRHISLACLHIFFMRFGVCSICHPPAGARVYQNSSDPSFSSALRRWTGDKGRKQTGRHVWIRAVP